MCSDHLYAPIIQVYLWTNLDLIANERCDLKSDRPIKGQRIRSYLGNEGLGSILIEQNSQTSQGNRPFFSIFFFWFFVFLFFVCF